MKKMISLLLALCLAAVMIPAFAEDDVTGEWYGNMMGMGIVMNFSEDGSFTMSAGGNVMASGTWKVEDGKLLADAEGSVEEFEIKDGTLYSASADMTLTRNPEDAPAAMEFADVKTDAAAEEFYGEWTCVALGTEGMVLDVGSYSEMSGGETAAGRNAQGDDGIRIQPHDSVLFSRRRGRGSCRLIFLTRVSFGTGKAFPFLFCAPAFRYSAVFIFVFRHPGFRLFSD